MFNITKYGTVIQSKHHTANYCIFHPFAMEQIDLQKIPTCYCMIKIEILYGSQANCSAGCVLNRKNLL
jgi:hypothetical protein